MATRNGKDIVESTVEVWHDGRGAFNVVSKVVTLEYTGCSREFAQFLAHKLENEGTVYPKPEEVTA